MKENRKKILDYRRWLIIIFFLIVIAVSAIVSWHLHQNSLRDKALKEDYFTVNQIKYGLLSGDKWTSQVNQIITQQIDSFSFSDNNRHVLKKQIGNVLGRLLDEVDQVLHKRQERVLDRIKFGVINAVVDVKKFRDEIPRFSNAIISELDKQKNKEELKSLLKEKVAGILNAASQDTLHEQYSVLRKYNAASIADFNQLIKTSTDELRKEQKRNGYVLLSCLAAVMLLWLYIFSFRHLYAMSFLFSVVVASLALFTGVSLPMIEIDARIARMDLNLLNSHIIFDDQVIFFQTKSILDVIQILVTNGKADSVFVGVLILLFSVLFPVTKLICTTIYLFRRNNNRFVKYMAFNSGKWSMADVMVIAIFMAYVGFQGILDNQLADITVHKETINLLTTNRTNLQTGFVLFVGFVLFNLLLAEVLKKITRDRDRAALQGK